MSQSPTEQGERPEDGYLDAFAELSQRIRDGQSFSGHERNCAFLNRGDGRFADAAYALGLDADDDGRGVAVADFDGDGDPDLAVTNRTAPRLRLLRNDLFAGARTLSLRPTGDPALGCPRDAAGARVEVELAGGRTLHRTLALGDGFASQSSIWLHFGLGADGEVAAVRVRWPGTGGVETFTGVRAQGRFVLEQGTGEAAAVPPPSLAAPLAAGAPPLPAETEVARIRLSQPLLLPEGLGFESAEGGRVALEELTDAGPVLVHLWASWCAPCLGELAEFAAAGGKLRAAEVTSVALSVDKMGDGRASEAEIAAALQATGFSGRAGYADAAFVGAVERLVEEALYRHRGFPVPTALLIDKGGWLTVVYKGAVTPERVLADAAKLGLGPDVARRESVPFPGRWTGDLFASHPVAVAAAFREGGELRDAVEHLQGFLAEHPVPPGSQLPRKQAAQLADVHFHLGDILAELGERRDALNHFRAAERFGGGAGRATLRRILALAEAGELEDAGREARALLDRSPADPNVLALCGDIALLENDAAAAAAYFDRVLAVDPRYVPALVALVELRAGSGDPGVRDPGAALRHARFLMGAPGADQNAEFVGAAANAYRAAGMAAEAERALARARELGYEG